MHRCGWIGMCRYGEGPLPQDKLPRPRNDANRLQGSSRPNRYCTSSVVQCGSPQLPFVEGERSPLPCSLSETIGVRKGYFVLDRDGRGRSEGPRRPLIPRPGSDSGDDQSLPHSASVVITIVWIGEYILQYLRQTGPNAFSDTHRHSDMQSLDRGRHGWEACRHGINLCLTE